MFVGIADTFVVSFSGEADVSGVSLVTSFNTVPIFLFTALCRSIGKTNVTMNVSIVANIINVVGNCIGVFALKMGAAGVAWPSLISRVLSAVAVTVYCFRKQNTVRYRLADVFAWDGGLLKKVMGIALPNGVENGVHQLVKIALSSMVALFGTYQIAANGVAQSIWSLASIMGLAMAPVYTTVIGQCMGARKIDAANSISKSSTGSRWYCPSCGTPWFSPSRR